MLPVPLRISVLLVVVAFCAVPAKPAEPPAWPADAYLQQLVTNVLPDTGPTFDGRQFARRGSRSATYIAAGLLWRDDPGDRTAAADILRGVLDLQYDVEPGSKLYGLWQRHHDETEPDANWREFIGCGLILILEDFRDQLPAELVADTEASLLRAAEGDLDRDVGPKYTNIALMSAFLLDYVGTRQGRPEIGRAGREKAEAIYELFSRHRTFDEYNSPTYYGPDLMALALWRRHAPSERLRELGRLMEADLWRDITAFYHPGMKNMCGPFVRAYGMDMTQYCALTGLWIAMAVGDPSLAPWPSTGGRHQGERAYGPVFALLGVQVPGDVLPELREFGGDRTFAREFGKSRATVHMEADLMMGAAELTRQWDQHHPATIYWQVSPEKPVGWILLTGVNENVAPAVVDRRLEIRRTKASGKPLEFLVFAPGLSESAITPQRWKLPGLDVAVDAIDGMSLFNVKWISHERYGRCLVIEYTTPEIVSFDKPVMVLQPSKPEP